MAPARTDEDGFAVAIKQVLVTKARRPFIQKDGDEKLTHTGVFQALLEQMKLLQLKLQVELRREIGHEGIKIKQFCNSISLSLTPDSDGVIWPFDTFTGFYRLGYGIILSIIAVLIIHPGFSYPTLIGWLPDPFFRIYVARAHKDKHGSDSGSYDHDGRFRPQQFEDIFSKYASGDKQSISLGEIWVYMKGQRNVLDPFGWGAALFEWFATYLLLWPEDGRMKKEDIRRIYDGSLFYEIAGRRSKQMQ